MNEYESLYPSFYNPFLIRPTRPMPAEMAVIGAGNVGADIAYFFRTGVAWHGGRGARLKPVADPVQ